MHVMVHIDGHARGKGKEDYTVAIINNIYGGKIFKKRIIMTLVLCFKYFKVSENSPRSNLQKTVRV